jgi:hypothetical protein
MAAASAQRRKRKSPTPFTKWLESKGVAFITKEFGVTRGVYYQWMNRDTTPDPSRLAKLLELSAGAFTAADIYPPARARSVR